MIVNRLSVVFLLTIYDLVFLHEIVDSDGDEANSIGEVDITFPIGTESEPSEWAKVQRVTTSDQMLERSIFRTFVDVAPDSTPYAPRITRGCPPDHVLPCVPKCCDIRESYGSDNKCTPSGDYFFPKFVDCGNNTERIKAIAIENRYEYFIGHPCREKFMLDTSQYPDDEHYLFSNGTLLYQNRLYTMEKFCLESVNGTTMVFMCFDEEEMLPFKFIIYPIGLLISIPFLLSTAIIYLGLPQLRDVHGQSLACHVTCLAIAYLFLALVQLASHKLEQEVCTAAAFIIQFFFAACFFWLNVLCIETWRNIRSDSKGALTSRFCKSEKMKFIYYSLYAWYGPFILSIVSLVMDLTPDIPESYLKPHFGFQSCWFQSKAAALPYFYGPVSIILFANLIFFILSARKLHMEKQNYKKLNRARSETTKCADKVPGKVKMYIRALKKYVSLFCVMGISWVAEIISWCFGGPDVIWLVTDIVNTLQGLIIFYIFVIKPRYVRREVEKILRRCCNCLENSDKGRSAKKGHYLKAVPDESDSAFCYSKQNNFRFIDASVTSLNNL